MPARIARWLIALLAPLALAGCLLTPGKFTSTLSINADRTFAFTYVGEVTAIDLADAMGKGASGLKPGDDAADDSTGVSGQDWGDDDTTPLLVKAAFQKTEPRRETANDPDAVQAKADARNRAIAAALVKEAGYRRVTYLGADKFAIDYHITGRLDRAFLWPYNLDAEMVLPFVVVEVRANGTVRMKAPGYANEGKSEVPGADDAAALLDGTFMLDTDAEIVSQNDEDGVVVGPGGRKTVTWTATPTTRSAPMAVLRMAAAK